MKRHYVFVILFVITLLFSVFPSSADEGMWLLTQLDKLPLSQMKQYGLTLTPEQIYNPNGTSIKDAIILLGGGSSTFVSEEGLILTNHHVAFAAIQSVSSVESDYLKNGFYAQTREEELSIPSYTAQMVAGIKDVTTEILSVVTPTMTPEERTKAIQTKSREVEKTAKGTSDFECRVSENYNGVQYILYTYEVLRDVRLVYAPPTAIGNFGGEVDNWYWPRHTGDFSFMRVYTGPDGKTAKYSKDNKPYHPKHFTPFSSKGYSEGSFAMIMGFPGTTYRYRTASEINVAKDETLPMTMKVFKKRMDIIEAAGKNNRAVEIKFASRWRSLANTYKKYVGVLEGMKRSDVVTLRRQNEEKFQAFITTNSEMKEKYSTLLSDIAKTQEDLKSFGQQQIVLGQILSGVDILRIASQFKDYANSFMKDSTGELRPPETKTVALKEFISNAFKIVDLNTDKEVLAALMLMACDVPKEQQIEAIGNVVGSKTGSDRERAIKKFVNELYDDTKLTTGDGCAKLMNNDPDDIRDDEFVQFAIDLDKTSLPLKALSDKYLAQIALLRSKLLEATAAWSGTEMYPDANRTLRFTYGQVKPYNPRDGVRYNYVTSLGGIMEKETGEEPFIVPAKLRELWEKKDFGPYADQTIGDIPVAFIANLDITGGNSGSSVLNGKGELIGLAFDGNWEAVVGDYVFQEPLNRTINVDARYILFILDKYSNAQNILKELVVR